MYTQLPDSSGNVLGYSIEGELTRDEVEQIQADIQELTSRYDQIRLLIRLDRLTGVDPSTAWRDLDLLGDAVMNVERIAIIGDDSSHEWTARLSNIVAAAELFEPHALSRAWEWIRSEEPLRSASG